MSMPWRFVGALIGVAIVSAGCDKSPVTGPGKPADETYAKKLVGVWEGTEVKDDKSETFTIEFKADGGFKVASGPAELAGTWTVVKEEGRTVTVDTVIGSVGLGELKGPNTKSDTKTVSILFEDANTIVMTHLSVKQQPKTLKRKV
jgi:hypothetical protein